MTSTRTSQVIGSKPEATNQKMTVRLNAKDESDLGRIIKDLVKLNSASDQIIAKVVIELPSKQPSVNATLSLSKMSYKQRLTGYFLMFLLGSDCWFILAVLTFVVLEANIAVNKLFKPVVPEVTAPKKTLREQIGALLHRSAELINPSTSNDKKEATGDDQVSCHFPRSSILIFIG